MRGIHPRSSNLMRALMALTMVAVVGCGQPAPPTATTAPKPAETKPAQEQATPAAEAAKPAAAPMAAPAAKPAEAAKPGGDKSLVIGMTHDFKTFDPNRVYETFGSMVVYGMYDMLVKFEGEDVTQPKPSLAAEWKADPNGKKFTFSLRDGVTFASGNPLTSADVKWSFERLKALKGQPSFLAANLASVETPDPKTVVVNLTNVDPAFLGGLARSHWGVVDSKTAMAQGAVSEAGADQTDKAEPWFLNNSAGSGAFILKEYVPKDRLVLERNPRYWGEATSIGRITLKAMDDPATQKLTLEKGDIDIAFDLTSDQVMALDKSKGVEVATSRSMTQIFAYFNTDPNVGGPLSNLDVQRAIRYAIDYDGLVELIGGGTIKLPSIIQLGFLGALGPDAAIKTDVAKAKELMAKAGFANGFRTDHEVGATSKSGGVAHLTVAQKLQTDLAKIGITTEIKTMDNAIALDRYRNGQTPLGSVGWGPDYPDALNQLAFCPGEKVGLRVNWKAEADQELATLCKQAMVELNEAKRADMLKQIQLMIMDRGPYANLIQPGREVGFRTGVDKVIYSSVYQLNLTTVDKK